MNFFQTFLTDIKAIGLEFWERIKNIPERVPVVIEQLPTAITGFVVVLAMLALIAVVILVFSKVMALSNGKKKVADTTTPAATPTAPATPAGNPLPANASAGSLDLVDVDEKTAAVIMAIVSKESGIQLNRLSFKSIKKTEDKK